MAENSKIAWTDDTFNPWWGCKRVGPGCDNCYAAALDKRIGGDYWDSDTQPRRTSDANWAKPRTWNRRAEKSGVRRKVFCASMADVFDNRVPPQWRANLWNLIKETPWLDWIVVTKRIGNVQKMLPADWGTGYPNVWLLITVINQAEADRDIPKLIDIPAKVRGLSIEPQLEMIDLSGWLKVFNRAEMGLLDDPLAASMLMQAIEDGNGWAKPALNWVICGAESGPKRRPFGLDWARALRDQCVRNGTAFFLKQIPSAAHKGVVETPELDGRRWVQFPISKDT